MNNFKVFYNGIELTKWLGVTGLDRGIGADSSNELIKIGASDGTYLKNRTENEKVIPMSFEIRHELISKRRELAGALSVKQPAKLVFSDEPDKYYLAVPDGDISVDEIVYKGKGVINWLVPEGVAWSEEEKVLVDVNGAFDFDYKGTADTFPRFEIENPTTNGFFGIVNQDENIIQIGNPEETDLVPYKRNERAIKDPFNTVSNAWTPNIGVTTYPWFLSDSKTPNKVEGSYKQGPNKTSIIPVFKANNLRVWSMPSLNRPVPLNSEGGNTGNFTSKARIHFYQRNVNERARVEMVVQTNNKYLAAIILRDSSTSKKEMVLDCYALGKRLGYFALDPKKYFGGFYELDITKMGKNFQFKISIVSDLTGKTPVLKDSFIKSFNLLEYANEPATSVTLLTGKFHDKPVNEVHYTDYIFDWIGVDKLEDVPNSFNLGDVVIVNNKKSEIALNDVIDYNLGALGNRYFPLTKGRNMIQVAWSDWAEKPTVKMYYQERWK